MEQLQGVRILCQLAEGLRAEPVLTPRQGARPGECLDGPVQGLLGAWETSGLRQGRRRVLPHSGEGPTVVVVHGAQEALAEREDARDLSFSESSEPRLKPGAMLPPEPAQASRPWHGAHEVVPAVLQPPEVLPDVRERPAPRRVE
jgi:hypothetical protein